MSDPLFARVTKDPAEYVRQQMRYALSLLGLEGNDGIFTNVSGEGHVSGKITIKLEATLDIGSLLCMLPSRASRYQSSLEGG